MVTRQLKKLCLTILLSTFFTHLSYAKPIVAVLPFQNLSTDKSIDWIGPSMSKEISLYLAKSPKIKVIDSPQVQKVMADIIIPHGGIPLATVKTLGHKLRAKYVVFGDFQKFSKYVKVSVYIYSMATGTVVDTLKESGDENEIFTIQDNIVKKTRIRLLSYIKSVKSGKSPPPKPRPKPRPKPKVDEDEYTRQLMEQQLQGSTISKEKEDQATLEVFQSQNARMTAEDWFRKGLALADNSDKEAECYKKAIELDPKFGPAYYNLGLVYYNRNMVAEAVKNFLKYLQYGTDVYKKSQIMTILNQLDDYGNNSGPGDREAAQYWYNKGAMLANGSQQEIRYYQWAIFSDPTFAPAHYNLANIYYEKGIYPKALQHYKVYMQYTNDPDNVKQSVQKIIDYLEQVVNQP